MKWTLNSFQEKLKELKNNRKIKWWINLIYYMKKLWDH
jgi:hypothetical protein